MFKYYPVLLSKQGELTALERLTQDVKARISPIIEVVPETFQDGWLAKKVKTEAARKKMREKKGLPEPTKKKEAVYENKLQSSLITHWSFPGNQVLLDFGHCTSTDPKNIWPFLNILCDNGVNVVPVITGNSSIVMIDIASTFATEKDRQICIRLRNQFHGFTTNTVIDSIMRITQFPKKDIFLFFDNGYVVDENYQSALDATLNAFESLTDFESWYEIMVSAGSFPENLNDPPFAPREEPYLPERFEWMLWNAIIKNKKYSKRVKYSDYGIKHPIYEDLGFSGTASIKYTAGEHFVIYRGVKPGEHALGNAQYIQHSKSLVTSEHYTDESFCWADGKIKEYSKLSTVPEPVEEGKKEKRPKSGAAKEWIAIGQNHHLTLIDSLIEN